MVSSREEPTVFQGFYSKTFAKLVFYFYFCEISSFSNIKEERNWISNSVTERLLVLWKEAPKEEFLLGSSF